jgi:tetratricopeptide (TPR) repeat protein
LVLPYPLHPYYSARIYSAIQEPHVLLAVGVMAISAVLLYRKRKQQELTFLAAWTFLMLIPPILMTNAFLWGPDHVYISERYLYVSAMPFSLLAAGVASVLAREGRESQVLIAWAAIIIAFSVISLSANTMWKDGRSLYVRIIKEGPNTAFAHNNLGVIFMDQKHFDEATREFRAALNVKPDYAVARYNLGLVHYNRGSFLEAIQEFNFALAINPDYADAQLNIGNACLKSGMIDQAIQSYKTAIQLNNNYALAHFNLGIAYEMKGSNESALVEYQEAIRISPGYSQAKNNIEALKQRLNYRR